MAAVAAAPLLNATQLMYMVRHFTSAMDTWQTTVDAARRVSVRNNCDEAAS